MAEARDAMREETAALLMRPDEGVRRGEPRRHGPDDSVLLEGISLSPALAMEDHGHPLAAS